MSESENVFENLNKVLKNLTAQQKGDDDNRLYDLLNSMIS